MSSPINIECDITQRCNLKCIRCNRFCDISSGINTDMTIDEVNSILSKLERYEINRFRIMGGEPTVNEQILGICNEICNQKNIHCIEFLTNFINKDIISRIQETFSRIKVLNLDGNTSENIKYKKFKRHINIYLSPKCESMPCTNSPCNMFNDYYKDDQCGIHIFKRNSMIKYMYSSVCSAVIRLLGRDDLFFDSVDDLIQSEHDHIYSEICQHCMMGNNSPVLVKDNISISEIFRVSIDNIKNQKA